MDITLVVLAAGIGQRYGDGIKQIARMDENGYTIIDYSIYDAIKAGFNKVVFIIRKDIEDDFKRVIGNRIEKFVKTEYAYQELDLAGNFKKPDTRKKPWGTVHAVLAAKDKISGPFLVINADDYYGSSIYKAFYNFFKKAHKDDCLKIAMAAYKLKNTLSDKGSVTRGICHANASNKLIEIRETHEIFANSDGYISSREGLSSDILNMESLVSMNTWASYPKFVDYCEEYFYEYLKENKDKLETCEYVLPDFIADLITDEKCEVDVLETDSKWIGITYKDDLEDAKLAFKKMIDEKKYPKDIWKMN